MEHEDVADFYHRYIQTCNEHRFQDLGEFVAPDVNSPAQDLDAYVEGLRQVVAAFPDYHWDVNEVVAQGDRLAVRLTGSGTHTGAAFRGVEPTGRRISTMELAMYHLRDGKIAAVWGDLGTTVRDELVSGPS